MAHRGVREKTLISRIFDTAVRRPRSFQRGFTLLEIVVALAIAGLFIGVAIPSSWKMYETMQYRKAIRDLTTALSSARYGAITSGVALDVLLNPQARSFSVHRSGDEIRAEEFRTLPAETLLSAETAAELKPSAALAAIRFYPDGSSSGGSVSVARGERDGIRLRVDWLMGRVTQEPL